MLVDHPTLLLTYNNLLIDPFVTLQYIAVPQAMARSIYLNIYTVAIYMPPNVCRCSDYMSILNVFKKSVELSGTLVHTVCYSYV